jgi:hypothetical protein
MSDLNCNHALVCYRDICIAVAERGCYDAAESM